jgi:hypothetical protein
MMMIIIIIIIIIVITTIIIIHLNSYLFKCKQPTSQLHREQEEKRN